jgi:hypothetical protein
MEYWALLGNTKRYGALSVIMEHGKFLWITECYYGTLNVIVEH